MNERYWLHRCKIKVGDDSICPECGQQIVWNGQAVVESVRVLTDEEVVSLVGKEITTPTLKQLYEQGLVGGKVRVTYPEVRKCDEKSL